MSEIRKRKTKYRSFRYTGTDSINDFERWAHELGSEFPNVDVYAAWGTKQQHVSFEIWSKGKQHSEYLDTEFSSVLVVSSKEKYWIMSVDQYNNQFEEL